MSILNPSLKDSPPHLCPTCKSKLEISLEIRFDPDEIKTNPNSYKRSSDYYCSKCLDFIEEVKDSTGQKLFD